MFFKYKLKQRIRSFVITLIALIFMVWLPWMVWGEDLILFSKIFLIAIWEPLGLFYFIGGLLSFLGGSHPLEKYMKETGITEEELSKEAENAQKFPSVLIGDKHVFVIAKKNFLVFPIDDLESLTVRAYAGASCQNKQDLEQVGSKAAAAVVINAASGLNTARGKGRAGYYYLFFHGKTIPDGSKLYFALWPSMAKVIAALQQAKPGLRVQYH